MGLINYVTRVHFGFGEIAQLGAELRLAGIARPLIVTDKGVRQLGVLERVEALLDAAPAGVFDDTPGNPNEAAVRAARDRVQLAKTGLGERGPAWWDQTPAQRTARWQEALARLDDPG